MVSNAGSAASTWSSVRGLRGERRGGPVLWRRRTGERDVRTGGVEAGVREPGVRPRARGQGTLSTGDGVERQGCRSETERPWRTGCPRSWRCIPDTLETQAEAHGRAPGSRPSLSKGREARVGGVTAAPPLGSAPCVLSGYSREIAGASSLPEDPGRHPLPCRQIQEPCGICSCPSANPAPP